METEATFSTDGLVERLFDSGLKSLELLTVYLGDRLGLYRELANGGAGTAAEVAKRANLNEDMFESGWSSRLWPAYWASGTHPSMKTSGFTGCLPSMPRPWSISIAQLRLPLYRELPRLSVVSCRSCLTRSGQVGA